jgi:hypothetical protein
MEDVARRAESAHSKTGALAAKTALALVEDELDKAYLGLMTRPVKENDGETKRRVLARHR